MDSEKDKFNSGKIFFLILMAVLFVSPVLLVMYFAGHKEFVADALKWCLLIVLIGPLINITGGYRLLVGWLRHREDKKWSKINDEAARRVDQQERSKKLKHSRYRDPKLPENW